MLREEIVIVGGGPCGLAAAIACMEQGFEPLVIEKDNVVSAIHRYPTHQTFFSTSEKLEIGGVPFVIEERKPRRNQALVYYREVVKRKNIRVRAYEHVENVQKQKEGHFYIKTSKEEYIADHVIIATGYYDSPNMMNIPGEDQSHVLHYFKEAHPYFDMDVVVIGGKNSAVDAALELEKAGARVTNLYRGSEYSTSVKPWILPEFESLVRHEKINMVFNAEVVEITDNEVVYQVGEKVERVRAQFVFAMTGYHPDHSFLREMGVLVDQESGRPHFNPNSMETNVEGLYIAGVIAAGNNANEIFIENGRFHGAQIANSIQSKKK
ncbi:YpdA family putative bacillithiol disulfide reductase [Halalkalibacter alkaliphilus]|uniref:YpdA family putative bacillithiol disulfide reductase n=1 Tax=Halalkalibacter alkaliphilus TaxID=2917993 RepID=A0A9X2A116_9BACI|nr:YpdA family putative bacillithiol disulfide reductase [Halalkalibacter alkaliphilus]MCL7745880.1 YpdA family putative bacillithiol disulfide reductase [Halalkalibacter alkaliphilus]